MKIRVSTLTGETLFFADVFSLLAMQAFCHGRAPVLIEPGTVLCVEAISPAGAMVRVADMRDGAGALKFGTLEAVPAVDPDATQP